LPKQNNQASTDNLPYNQPNSHVGKTANDALSDISGRVLDAEGLNLLQMTSISKNQVFHIASMIMRASILDTERIKKWRPLSSVWLEAFLCGRRGSDPTFKVGVFDWGRSQIDNAGVEEETEGGVDA
jgi:hypothetical protein